MRDTAVVRIGSTPEVQREPQNVCFWGQSGSRFRATRCILVATSRPNASVAGHGLLVQTAARCSRILGDHGALDG